MSEISCPDIGTRIAALRKANGLTQRELAQQLHITVKHCSEVERGYCMLSLEKLAEVSGFFGCTLDYLVLGVKAGEESFVLPAKMLEDMRSGDERKKIIVQKYLQMYGEIKA